MKAVVCEKWGDPTEVLQVRDLPTPEPGAVRCAFACWSARSTRPTC